MGQIGSLVSFAPNTIIRSADHNSNNNTIKTTYNTHDAATSGMHGITGSFVGTSDSQTLTNKTLTAPTITSAVLTGDTSFGTNLLYIDDTNNRIYSGATATTTIDSVNYQFQLTSLSAGTSTMALISTAAGATGVIQASYHNSASPADADAIYRYSFYGNNDAATAIQYCSIVATADDVSAGTEDSHLSFQAMNAGTLATRLFVYGDQVQVAPESLVVGDSTNVFNSQTRGLYVNRTTNQYIAVLRYQDNSATGMSINLVKDSASPAVSDELATIFFSGRDSATNVQPYASIIASIVDPTSTSEDGKLTLTAYVAGSDTTHLTISEGTTAITGLATITSTTTTSNVCTITADSLTTGSALRVYSNSSSSSSRNLVSIINDNSSADGTVACYIQNDGDDSALIVIGNSVFPDSTAIITNNGSGYALEVSTTAGSANDNIGIYISASNSGGGDAYGLYFDGIGTDYFFGFGTGVSTAAAGSYYGKIPVTDDGGVTTKYIHLFN